jgi:hypothetical protein
MLMSYDVWIDDGFSKIEEYGVIKKEARVKIMSKLKILFFSNPMFVKKFKNPAVFFFSHNLLEF